MLSMVAASSLLMTQAHATMRPMTVQDATPVQSAPVAAPDAGGTLTLPADMIVPLTLVSMIKSKAIHLGEPVRAQVAFPVSVGDRVAIPVGTFVEGQLVQTTSKVKVKKGQPKPQDLIVHFTRMIFANGYTVSLDGTNMAEIVNPEPGPLLAYGGAPEMGFAPQSTYPPFPPLPPLPPLPPFPDHHGPNPVAISLGVTGAFAVLTAGALLLAHHASKSRTENTDSVLFDSGWQFEMTLKSPVVLDAAQVHSAVMMAQ